MTDLDSELRRGLAGLAPSPRTADDLLPEFRRRLGRRRQRRTAGVGAVAVALLVAAVALAARTPVDDAEPVAPTTTTTTIVAVVPDVELGPAVRPGDVALPAEGVAVEVPSVGVVLVTLDGRVLGHLPGFTLDDEGENGPLVVTDLDRSYSLVEGRPAEVARNVVPLAHGAELVRVGDGDPGRFAVQRNGRTLFDVSNNMDGFRHISYDRDIVTNLYETYSEAWDLRTGRTRKHPASCWVADRHGSREYVVCGMPTLVRVGNDDLVDAPEGVGQWQRVMASPDGKRLLLQWMDDCEAQTVMLAPSGGGGAVTKPFGDVMAEALGWAADGRFLATLHGSSGCGSASGEPGIYAVAGDGTKARIYAGTGFRALVWSPPLH